MAGSLRAGDEFAGYEIVQALGAGGMGAVYKARDRDLPRFVALKLLTVPGGGGAEHHARFRREADAVARLDHPNIVTVYARGQDDDRLWIAMTYVDGEDVSVALREGPLNPGRAVRIITETAGALDHAHAAGILHRDVKPANILLTRGQPERVLLTDFGIAKTLDESRQLTDIGEVLASFHYAAPERWTGPGDADHRADVYSLGCTLYHMLTGRLPFPGKSVGQLLYNHAYGEIPRPTRHIPTLPTGFDEVIARALHKDPAGRYENCTQLARAALQSLREPSHPRYPTPPRTDLLSAAPAPKDAPRHPNRAQPTPTSAATPHPAHPTSVPTLHPGTTSRPGRPPAGSAAHPGTTAQSGQPLAGPAAHPGTTAQPVHPTSGPTSHPGQSPAGTTARPDPITPSPKGSGTPVTDPRSQPTLPKSPPTGHHPSGPQFTGATSHPPRQAPQPTGVAARPTPSPQLTGAAAPANQQGAQRALPAEPATRQGAPSGGSATPATRQGPPTTVAANRQGVQYTGTVAPAKQPGAQHAGDAAQPNRQGPQPVGPGASAGRAGSTAAPARPAAPAAGQVSGPNRRPLPPTRQLPQIEREAPRVEPVPRFAAADSPPTLLDTAAAAEPPDSHDPPPRATRVRNKAVWVPPLVAVLIVVVALAYLQSRQSDSTTRTLPTTTTVSSVTYESSTTDAPPTTTVEVTATSYRPTPTTTTTSYSPAKPPTVTVPDVVGALIAAAKAKLEAAGFVVVQVERKDAAPKGTVLALDPAAGTERATGTKITAYVSTGETTTTVTMPNLVGHTTTQAAAALKAAGWTGTLQTTTKKVTDETQSDKVIAQSVAASTTITPDAPVTVTVGETDPTPST
ncbi:protein kinase [Nocardia sp. NPDC057668]|uniref:serine/threonine protein kinase n=1 Tax=Nocardia sp. NPDC057668 TaxID=3346202 RepID=UPI00366DD2D5